MTHFKNALIRKAIPGEEQQIHDVHMRSIREVCVKDHGEDEIKGWGFRELGNRWYEAIKQGRVYVVELEGSICGVGSIDKLIDEETSESFAYIHALYFTPEIIGLGLGKQVLTKLLNLAKKWKITTIKLDSTITALEFYQKQGFRRNGEMKKVLIGGHPVTSYPLILSIKQYPPD